ncbi:hypothetical protein Ait01nite_045810 [Actinoplanes italicus]|nr:hypothetical protein Ait01nite_045810 [Actinoplanes italicus]
MPRQRRDQHGLDLGVVRALGEALGQVQQLTVLGGDHINDAAPGYLAAGRRQRGKIHVRHGTLVPRGTLRSNFRPSGHPKIGMKPLTECW